MRLISESKELAQGVKIFLVGVLSLVAVDEAFSFYTKTFGSRAPRLHLGGVRCGQLYAWKQDPGAGLSLRLHSPLVRDRPVPMH